MIKRTLIFLMLFAAFNAHAQMQSIKATIDAGQTGAPISKRIYGQFIEHIAGIIILKMYTGKIVPDYLGPWDWSGGLLSHCLENIDMLSEHYYAYSYQRFDFDKGERVPDPGQTFVEWARQPANYVRV
jgi:alpha-L-arabinofuranosidase